MKSPRNNRGKFNIVDALIILFILTVLALTVYVFILGNDLADLYSTEEQITYTVAFENKNSSYDEMISVGDTVYHWNSTANTGKVEKIEILPYDDKAGEDICITVSATARKIKSSYYINGKKIEKDAFLDISLSKIDLPENVKCVSVQAN